MQTTDAQVRRLMEEMSKHGKLGLASLRAGMDRKTGRKYWKAGKLPSQLKKPRTWRTREDPFEVDWSEVVKRLEGGKGLAGKIIRLRIVKLIASGF